MMTFPIERRMNHTDLIKRLRDALYFRQPCTHKRMTRPTEENNWLSECRDCGAKNHLTLTFGHDRERAREIAELIAEADAHLKSGGWVRVDEALPVVPNGANHVPVWAYKGFVYSMNWYGDSTAFAPRVTHWRYDQKPSPPEQTK